MGRQAANIHWLQGKLIDWLIIQLFEFLILFLKLILKKKKKKNIMQVKWDVIISAGTDCATMPSWIVLTWHLGMKTAFYTKFIKSTLQQETHIIGCQCYSFVDMRI